MFTSKLNHTCSWSVNLFYWWTHNRNAEINLHKPMVSSRSARKIIDYLVRAKLYPPKQNVGSRKCNKIDPKCVTILNVQISVLAQLLVRHKINYYFNCDSKCLVCSITCRTCELRCTGQTCDAFWKRWNNYRSCTRKAVKDEEYKQKYLHKLFLQDDHHNAQVILIDQTQASGPLKHTIHMVWILRRHISVCYYVGLLHDFVRFFEELGFIT